MNQKIEIKHNGKTYEIDKDTKEQKVRPKGITLQSGVAETEENKAVTFKNYQEDFWGTSVEADGVQVNVKWGAGNYLSYLGAPASGLVITIGAYLYKYWQKPTDEAVNILDKVVDEVKTKQK
jgi:hypothetical protein